METRWLLAGIVNEEDAVETRASVLRVDIASQVLSAEDEG